MLVVGPGSKGVYYLRCAFVDGTSPTVNLAVDKFTDMARNLNTVGVVLTGGGADIASDGKFKINFS